MKWLFELTYHARPSQKECRVEIEAVEVAGNDRTNGNADPPDKTYIEITNTNELSSDNEYNEEDKCELLELNSSSFKGPPTPHESPTPICSPQNSPHHHILGTSSSQIITNHHDHQNHHTSVKRGLQRNFLGMN